MTGITIHEGNGATVAEAWPQPGDLFAHVAVSDIRAIVARMDVAPGVDLLLRAIAAGQAQKRDIASARHRAEREIDVLATQVRALEESLAARQAEIERLQRSLSAAAELADDASGARRAEAARLHGCIEGLRLAVATVAGQAVASAAAYERGYDTRQPAGEGPS